MGSEIEPLKTVTPRRGGDLSAIVETGNERDIRPSKVGLFLLSLLGSSPERPLRPREVVRALWPTYDGPYAVKYELKPLIKMLNDNLEGGDPITIRRVNGSEAMWIEKSAERQ